LTESTPNTHYKNSSILFTEIIAVHFDKHSAYVVNTVCGPGAGFLTSQHIVQIVTAIFGGTSPQQYRNFFRVLRNTNTDYMVSLPLTKTS